MLLKDARLALQLDVTATPRHNNGAIFTEKHADYVQLGIEEWRKSYAENEALGKKAVRFVMVDDTRNCDEVGAHLKRIAPELTGAVLVIHTKNTGEISEADAGKNKDELERLRKQSNEIDTWKSPFKAIVSVLMLKEGWDVRNVTTIVGLRAYAAQSNILPEQTLGRGLRRMYFGSDRPETVSVMGTPAFMDFVESIQSEGVTFDRIPMATTCCIRRSRPFCASTCSKPRLPTWKTRSCCGTAPSPRPASWCSTTSRPASTRSPCETAARPTSETASACATPDPSAPSRAASSLPKKSVFNRMVGEANAGGLELEFAAFLEAAADVQAHAKNYMAVGFKIDYVRANGDLSTYTPDFIVRDAAGAVWVVETKGREELDLPQKMARLEQWCADATAASVAEGGPRYGFVYVDQEGFEQHRPQSFAGLVTSFCEYQQTA